MILNRKRFLAKHGLDDITSMGGGGGQVVGQPSNPLKAQIVGLLHAVQYLKPVVIIANGITILFELVLGGSWEERKEKMTYLRLSSLPISSQRLHSYYSNRVGWWYKISDLKWKKKEGG